MRYAYPLMLDVSDRLIVIVGGGAVAARKAAGVIAAGATRVRAVAPEFCKAMPAMNVERILEQYAPQHLDGGGLVFAATNDAKVNEQVVRDARASNILVCRADADDDAPGDFTTPALFRDGRVTVTVSAHSAALASMIRDQLARSWQSGWSAMADAMHDVRREIHSRGDRVPIERRSAIFRDLASQQAIDLLQMEGVAKLREWLAQRHPEAFSNASGS